MKSMLPTSTTVCSRTSRTRPYLTTTLIFLCLVLFFYQLVPGFTTTADSVIAKVASHVRPSPSDAASSMNGICSEEIGDDVCCHLYLAAEPCRDECRKQFVDRETMALTVEYDECADQCSAVYDETCKTKKEDDDSATEGPSS